MLYPLSYGGEKTVFSHISSQFLLDKIKQNLHNPTHTMQLRG